MRPLTYVLWCNSRILYNRWNRIGYRGFQVEGGITLIVGVLGLIQFIRFLREDTKSN